MEFILNYDDSSKIPLNRWFWVHAKFKYNSKDDIFHYEDGSGLVISNFINFVFEVNHCYVFEVVKRNINVIYVEYYIRNKVIYDTTQQKYVLI